MASPRFRIGLCCAALALGLSLLVWAFRPLGRPSSESSPPAAGTGRRATAEILNPIPTGPGTNSEEKSRLAEDLNSVRGDVRSDLREIDEIFVAYRSGLRSGNPVGENVEITAALKGRNRLGFAFIPADCPAINGQGELCDRWGTPYFFHQLSGEHMEVRSAGPDRKLWTADDVVYTP